MNKPGIALVMVLLCLSSFLIIIFTAYKAASLVPNFAHYHVKRQTDETLLDGALLYALEFCKENWQRLVFYAKQGERQEIFFVPSLSADVQARITITLGTKEQHLEIALFKNQKETMCKKVLINNTFAITTL